MCGFVGFVNQSKRQPEDVIRSMADTIRHRGPDDEGYFEDDFVSLGFRRLSIIDLACGKQPMENEDGSLVVVFNGEIYNYQELREALTAKGHLFRTQSDTETLLHGYEEFGRELPSHLRGMFAFVIYDKKNKTLFGARDMFGIKPFYYYQKDSVFLFGSEIKAFLPHPDFEKELNEKRLPDYLCYEYLPDDETMFCNVFKLPNGASFFYHQDGSLQIEKYFEYSYQIDESKTLSQWRDEIAASLTESVRAHQISDVEVGCFLSSGVDSSYVVKEVSKTTDKVKTFSIGYEEEKYSELPYAQALSKAIGVENISSKVDAAEFFDAAGQIQYFLDEPLPNPSEVPLFFLAKNAAQYVKVVLSGEGADELFGGYPLYLAGGHFEHYSRRFPAFLRKAVAKAAAALPSFKGRNFLIRGGMKPYERYMRANYVFNSKERAKYLKKDIPARPPEQLVKPLFDKVSQFDEPTQLQFVDLQTWMLYDILLKADRMSMANSLELRVPFLDKKMLAVATQIPTRYRSDHEVTKVALREAAARELPEQTAKMKKLGFPVPLQDWLREDKYYERVRTAFCSEIADKFFNQEAILELLDEHKANRASNMKKIWTIYSFILWYEQFFVLH